MTPRPWPAAVHGHAAGMLLAFETTGRSGTACLCADDGRELAYAALDGVPSEAGLVPMLDRLCREHGRPTTLAIAAGPGSFTGLRVGITAGRSIAWLDQIPVHPVDSLAACAAMAGDGLWWVAMPLKKDTTFHGVFQMAAGRLTIVRPSVAVQDADALPFVVPAEAAAIGPALATKPGLVERLSPGVRLGSPAGPDARGVARLAAQVPAVAWDALLPVYGQEPAPVLQRRAAGR